MDDDMKVELVRQGIPALVVPAVRALTDHHLTMRQMEKEKDIQMKVAERRAEGARSMMGEMGGDAGGVRASVTPGGGRDDPVTGGSTDVYDDLENLRGETDCSFCHSVIDSLMDASPNEARTGYEEIRSYVREVERIEGSGMSEAEAEQKVNELVDRWEVVPKYAVGLN